MSEIKHTPTEGEAFEQWVEEYRKGKPYWSTARIEICRDAWVERAKRDAAPELLERLEELLEYSEILRGSAVYKRAQDAIAKARGAA